MIVLKGERIYLKIPTMKDMDGIMKHINDRLVSRFMATVPHPYKRKDGEFYIKKMVKKNLKEKTGYLFSICLKENDEIIGGIGLLAINKQHKNAEIGYWLGRKFWRKGYGTEALHLMLGFGFKRLKLNKIFAPIYHPNKASMALLKKAGFKKEGVLRKHCRKGDKWFDEHVFAMLSEEYKGP
jgi:RimJ/RimL family protein N-acetyltransferase